MSINAYKANRDMEILTADPLRLVVMLYRSAMESVEAARRHLAKGEIKARSRRVDKACAILEELTASMDRTKGGALADNLVELYDYMHRALVDANIRQADEPLAEVQHLLGTLLEAWREVEEFSSRLEEPVCA